MRRRLRQTKDVSGLNPDFDKDAHAPIRKRVLPFSAAIVMCMGAWVCSIQAQATWNAAVVNNADRNTTGSGDFTWSTVTAWDGNGVANGAGLSVSLEPRGSATITVDGTYTVGTLTSRADPPKFTGDGKLIFDNGASEAFWNVNRIGTRFTTLRPDINVNVQLNSDLDLRYGAARPEEATVGRIGRTISGTGALTLTLGNNDSVATGLFKLGEAGANTYQGGTAIRHISQIAYGTGYGTQKIVQLNAVSTGAFGTGNVTINGTGCTDTCKLAGVAAGRGMWVRFNASDVMANGTTLNLVTADRIALELVAGTSQTLAAVNVEGSPIADGTYDGGDFLWLYGSGTLIVGGGGSPEPEMDVLGTNGVTEIANGSTTLSQSLGTDFGEVLVVGGTPVTNTFTIANSGTATLTLSGSPVAVLGDHSTDFTVTQPVSSTIAADDSVTFSISFYPGAMGTRTGLVSIASDDSNENPYTFSIRGTGTELHPVMSILGSDGVTEIVNGDTTLSQSSGTEFGEILWIGAVSNENTFAITNMGTADLTLTLPITISGVDSADFTVTQPASATLAAGEATNFKIACDPSALGVRTGVVSIINNDSSPYTFNIQGEGIPEQLSFQQGDGGAYSDTAATYIEERAPAVNHGSELLVKLEEEYRNSTHLLYQGLIAFPSIIGQASGQIAPDSTITSAILTLTVSDEGAAGTPVTLHQMLKPWVEDEATWTLLQTGSLFGNSATNPLDNAAALAADPTDPIDDGGGMPGVDYVEANIASQAAYPPGKVNFDVTAIVQAWADGDPNYGLYLQYLDVNGLVFESDDAATQADRPRLVVRSTPPTPKGTVIILY